MKQWVDDDVWEQLDPRAGGLTRTQRHRAVAAVAAAGALLAAGYAIDRSGVVRAHVELSVDTGTAAAVSANPKILSQEVPVKNTGWRTVRVIGIGRSGPGLSLLGTAETNALGSTSGIAGTPPPFDLHPGQTVIMAVAYRVTDCQAVPVGRFTVPVRVDRPWGTQTIDISLPQSPDSKSGTTVDQPMVEWQKAMADQACGVRH